MSVDFDFQGKLFSTQEAAQDEPELSFFKGHLKADISKLDLLLSLGLRTQEAMYKKGTGMREGAEAAPAISVERLDLTADAASSHIQVTGGVTEFLV